MTAHPRIALIHATRVAIEPIEIALKSLWPEALGVSQLEEGLALDVELAGHLTPKLTERIELLTFYAINCGAQAVLFTCSAFGDAIEAAASKVPVPVLKPNEAMFDEAFACGPRVSMIYTFEPAREGMEKEFRIAAEQRSSSAKMMSVFCEGALDALKSGDTERHDRLIADAAAAIRDADVILLAQFSMARAAPTARKRTTIPVLTSPETAVLKLKACVAASLPKEMPQC